LPERSLISVLAIAGTDRRAGGPDVLRHAALYGSGAYAAAMLQIRLGVNLTLRPACVAAGAAMGVLIGACVRYGLRGSYFALVTLAFAEVLRILASSFEITGAGSA
jgi:branched-chain amino acid transport system permease protein